MAEIYSGCGAYIRVFSMGGFLKSWERKLGNLEEFHLPIEGHFGTIPDLNQFRVRSSEVALHCPEKLESPGHHP